VIAAAAVVLDSCNGAGKVQAKAPGEPGQGSGPAFSVGVVKVGRKNLERTLTVSSELVPFQEIDVFAKESGFVKELNVDYGSRVQANQVLATLEIPELQSQVKEDDAAVKNAEAQIPYAQDELNRMAAQQRVLQLQFDRQNGVAKSK
jgi:multidrug efflux pump subunit AcrA (membrane-fusion protein)